MTTIDKTFDERVNTAVIDAEVEFWGHIAKQFPEIKTGDLAPDATFEFQRACDKVVRTWYNTNLVGCHTPSATYHALKQLREEFPEMEWRDESYGNDSSDSLKCDLPNGNELGVWMQNPEEDEIYFGVSVRNERGEDVSDDAFEDFQQVVAFIRKEHTKPPRKPILWAVFNVKDVEGIKRKSGYTVGNEIEISENDVSVFFSSVKNYYVFLDNRGKFHTDAINDTIEGTLDECANFIEKTLGETVE